MRYPHYFVVCFALAVNGCTPNAEPSKGTNSPVVAGSEEKVVRTVIANLLKVEPADIPMDKPISDPPLKADDLDLVEIVMELEERLGVEVKDAALEQYNGAKLGSGTIRITPNHLVSAVKAAPKLQPANRRK